MTTNPNPAALPGRGEELDRLVAEKIAKLMGYEWITRTGPFGDEIGRWSDPKTGDDVYPSSLWEQPEYSTSWDAAKILVEFIKKYITEYVWLFGMQNKWIITIRDAEKGQKILSTGRSKDMPYALCLAFLTLSDSVLK